MVVLGGMGNLTGSLISATLITYLNYKLRTVLTGDAAVLKDLIYALILIAIVIYNNAPALKNFREKYSIRRLFGRLRRHDPSVIKDDAAEWSEIPTKIKMDEILSVDLKPGDEFTPDKPDRSKEDK